MASTVRIPLVGGPADGETVDVELDANERPPLTHHHMGPHGLAEAQIYELESASGEAGGWRYRHRMSAV